MYDERDNWGRTAGGRHALNEDAVLTPIFHALTRGGWRSRQHEASAAVRTTDPVEQFRQNPLTAPIPIQAVEAALIPAPTDGSRREGRHHRRREAVASY